MFDGFIRDHARMTPRALALLTPQRRASYAELNADVNRLGAVIAAFGVGPATGVVAVSIDDPYLQYVAIAALARLGCASSPGNDPEADLCLTDAAPDPANTTEPDGRYAKVAHLTPERLQQMRRTAPTPLPRLDLDPLAIGRVMLSSGTTRKARRIGLTWRRLNDGNHAGLYTYCAAKAGVWTALTSVDSMIGLTMLIGAWSTGAAITNGFDVERFPQWFELLDPGILGCTPNHLRRMLRLLPPDMPPRPGLRLAVGGALLPEALAREARMRITPDLRLTYGSTEAGMTTGGTGLQLEGAPGCVGIPVAGNVVEIVGDDGQPLGPGETGEIRVRGERVVAGYLGDPEATAERFRDGWFYPGDAGQFLPDGRLVIEGRIDDRMNLGGVKFMPARLEDAALECPGVLDAAAFAAPDNAGFDQCWLAVVTGPDFDRESLGPHLAPYNGLPARRFAWTEEIPRNAMGKVERNKLRDALLAVIGGG